MLDKYTKIPLKKIVESKTNPRKTFNETDLNELAESIKQHGLIQPIVVREIKKDTYEIVAGARRFRASKLGKLEEIPAIVRELDDTQVLEIQIIENLQREDVHPFDEAVGFKILLDSKQYSVKNIAEKLGKTEQFVYQRLALNNLTEEAQKLFIDNFISLGHARLLARLTPEFQGRAITEVCYESNYNTHKRGKKLSEAEPLDELEGFISRYVNLDLDKAPFKTEDETLGACPCNQCPKNTGANGQLFPELSKKRICTDPTCYNRKVNTMLENKRKEFEDKGIKIIRGSERSEPKNKELIHIDLNYGDKYEKTTKSDKNAIPVIIEETYYSSDSDKVGAVVYVKPKTGASKRSAADNARLTKERNERIEHDNNAKAKYKLVDSLASIIKFDDLKCLQLLYNGLYRHFDHESKTRFKNHYKLEIPKSKYGNNPDYDLYFQNIYKEIKNDAEKLKQGIIQMLLIHHVGNYQYEKSYYDSRGENKELQTHKDLVIVAAESYGLDLKKTMDEVKKEREEKKKKSKKTEMFDAPMNIGEALQPIVGKKPLPKTEVTKKLWAYIKKNNLKDPKKRTQINADVYLKRVFGGKKSMDMFAMTKLVNGHLTPIQEEKPAEETTKKKIAAIPNQSKKKKSK